MSIGSIHRWNFSQRFCESSKIRNPCICWDSLGNNILDSPLGLEYSS